jgi:hypothetical protein
MATSGTLQADAYTAYMETGQGKSAAADPGRYFVFGADPELDKLFTSDSSKYAIRIVRKFKDSDTCIVADLNGKAFLETINRLNLSGGSVLGVITEDGKELLAEKDTDAGTDSAQQSSAAAGDDTAGQDTAVAAADTAGQDTKVAAADQLSFLKRYFTEKTSIKKHSRVKNLRITGMFPIMEPLICTPIRRSIRQER